METLFLQYNNNNNILAKQINVNIVYIIILLIGFPQIHLKH